MFFLRLRHPTSRLLAFFRRSLFAISVPDSFRYTVELPALRVSDDESKTGARDLPRFRGTSFRWLEILTEPQNAFNAAVNSADTIIPS